MLVVSGRDFHDIGAPPRDREIDLQYNNSKLKLANWKLIFQFEKNLEEKRGKSQLCVEL